VRRRRPLWGFFPKIRCSHHQVEEGGRSWRKEGGAGGGEEAGGHCGAWPTMPCWSCCFAVREEEDRRRRGGKKEPEQFKSPTTAPSPSRTPLLPLHRVVRLPQPEPRRARFCILCSASASPPHLDTAASPPCPGAQGEPQPPRPCCGPGLRAEAGPSLVSLLFVCCPLSRTAPPRRPAVA
jgi:hypothetical protein